MASTINASTTGSGGIVQTADASGVLQLQTAGTTAVTVDSSQNVTLNNVIPSGSTAPTNGMFLPTTNTVGFSTASAERMRIDASGNVLVGRTSAFAAGQGSSPSLQVSTAGTGGIVLTNGSNGLIIYRDNTNQITYFFNGSNQAALTAAGAWSNASDAKLKKEIVDIKYGLNTVLKTQPRSYKRVDVDGDYIGFVAQELKEKIPEVVFGNDDIQYSVDYGSLVAVAFKAIQELKAIVDTQAEQIKALQGASV